MPTAFSEFGDLRIAVDISTNKIKRDMIGKMVAAVVAETAIHRQRLVLELTELAAIVLMHDMRQMQLAKAACCDLFQDFHIARPMPKNGLLAFLAAQRDGGSRQLAAG